MVTLITPLGLPDFLGFTDVTPFTYKDGMTYQEKLERIQAWLSTYLVPTLNTEFTDLNDDYQTQVTDLVNQTNVLIEQINGRLGDLSTFVTQCQALYDATLVLKNAADASATAAAGSATAAANSATAAAGSATTAASAGATAGASAGATAGASAGATAGTDAGTTAGTTAGAAAGTTSGTAAATAAAPAAAATALNAQKNVANGIAGLDSNSRIVDAQLPTRIQTTNFNEMSVADPAALSALTTAIIGDKRLVIAPGTGIDPFIAECWSTPSSTNSKWRPIGQIYSDTDAHLTSFIAAWITDTDLTFKVGQFMFALDKLTQYRITTTAGIKKVWITDSITDTPTLTNFTIGNGTHIQSHQQVGNKVKVFGKITFGSTTVVTGQLLINIPIPADTTIYTGVSGILAGKAFFADTGVAYYCGTVIFDSSSSLISLLVDNSSSTYVNLSNISSVVPFAASTGDVFTYFYEYIAA